MSQKEEGALRTIGEAADEVGVATHVLRFWEDKFPKVNPQKRRGRRYYRPEDIHTLKRIKTLLYDEGYTIKGVKKHLKENPKQEQTPDVQMFAPVQTPQAPQNDDQRDLFGHVLSSNNGIDHGQKLSEANIKKLKQIQQGLHGLRDLLQQKPLV